jgi:apolipoprotein N-acyltransferase
MPRFQHAQAAQALPATLRQRCSAFLLASATALLTTAPSFYEALWPLAWVALVPLFVALRAASPKRTLLLGWWAETLMYWVGFYWLIGTMVRFGFIAVPLSVCFFAIIGLGNGIRLGLFAWWLRRTERSTYPWWVRLLLPACTYVALDYLYPRVFPWYLGFLQLPGLPFIQIADIAGVHGVTFVLVVCNTVVAAFVPHPAQPERQEQPVLNGANT